MTIREFVTNPPSPPPPDTGPGSIITIANPNGGTMQVTVPPNSPPGTVINVQAPQQQPMVVVATVEAPPQPIQVTATVVKQG